MTGSTDDDRRRIVKEAVERFVDALMQGEEPNVDEFVRHYPDLKDQIRESIQDAQRIDVLFDSLVQADERDFTDTATGEDLVGQRIGSFEIAEMIGRGGMGVVYLARDTKLKRSVAIKSIPADLQADATARMRFRREAELLASLNHPNIAAIHDIIEPDESAGYLVLEYVPGETLAQRIAHEPLNVEEALSIAQQIAEGISAAHEKGVVHRDLKPGNIKITPEGKVKVLDFGLAKPSAREGADIEITSTEPGHIIGTPAYMSPEQARGNPTDHRTDIWSFGCIIYQMLTGRSPFESDTATDTLARIIERQPDWGLLPEGTPERIRVLVRRCLEKNQDERLGEIADAAVGIGEALNLPVTRPAAPVRSRWRWVTAIGFVVVTIVVLVAVVGPNIGRWREQLLGGAGPGRITSLAVLPVQNLTGDPNREYVAEGMTETLIADLGKIGALRVISRQSVMRYRGSDRPLPEIARELDVDAVVEGSVMRVRQQVRVEARLFHAPTDTRLWGDSYQRKLGDVPILLSEVVRTIAREIEITITPDVHARLAARRSVDPETYNLYLKGMFHLNKETPEGTRIGLDYLHQATAQDPADPLAYGGLALGYVMSTHGPGAPADAFERAKAAALRALELDDSLAEAHAALAMAKAYRDRDWEGAAKAYERALQLNPNLTLTRAHYAFYLLLFGCLDDALAEMRRVQGVDPLTPLWPAWQGLLCLYAEQYDEAIKETNKSLELNSDFPVALYAQGCAYALKEMYEEAIELHQKAGELSHEWKCGLARTYALAGRLDEARQALAELEADHTLWDTWYIALIYVALGEKDQAFRWLEAAYGPPSHPYLPWISRAPGFKPLRDDPRFKDLLRRMNIPD